MKIQFVSIALLAVTACGPQSLNEETTDEETATAEDALGGLCGSSYNFLQAKKLHDGFGHHTGNLKVFYSPASQRNCAVVQESAFTQGKRVRRAVGIRLGNASEWHQLNTGYFPHHPAPVYSPISVGRCIDVLGLTYGGTQAQYERDERYMGDIVTFTNAFCG